MYVPVVLHGVLVAATALSFLFAHGASTGERLLLTVVHPLAAVGLLMLVFTPRLPIATVGVIGILLVINVIADLIAAALIVQGHMKEGWELALLFAAIPAIGIVYAVARLRSPSA